EDVLLTLPLGKQVTATTLSSKLGNVNVDESTKDCTWQIKALGPQGAQLDGTLSWSSSSSTTTGSDRPGKPIIHVSWRAPGWAASGLKVESLTLTNEKYNHFKGVKH